MSLHTIGGKGEMNSTVIAAVAVAEISLRIVPDQHLDTIKDTLLQHIQAIFAGLGSNNKLDVDFTRTADWWLGAVDDRIFHQMEASIERVWGVKPLRIREGGSIPALPCLQKLLRRSDQSHIPTVLLPMGQHSDAAHLSNERIRLENLLKGQAVLEEFLRNVGDSQLS